MLAEGVLVKYIGIFSILILVCLVIEEDWSSYFSISIHKHLTLVCWNSSLPQDQVAGWSYVKCLNYSCDKFFPLQYGWLHWKLLFHWHLQMQTEERCMFKMVSNIISVWLVIIHAPAPQCMCCSNNIATSHYWPLKLSQMKWIWYNNAQWKLGPATFGHDC